MRSVFGAVGIVLHTARSKIVDVYAVTKKEGQGIHAHLAALNSKLYRRNIRCIDTSVHFQNADARRFYTWHGFQPLDAERLVCLVLAMRAVGNAGLARILETFSECG